MKKIVLMLVGFVIVFPMLMVLLLSFFSYYRYPLLFPRNFTLAFWVNTVLKNKVFLESLLNSIFIGVLNGCLTTLIGMMTARAIVNHEFKGKRFMSLFYSVPLFIPAVALFIGVHLMMIKFSIVNSYGAVVLAHMIISIPYSTSIFISFFTGISRDMENAARTLGCNTVNLYKKILMPLLVPGIALSFSISFLLSISEYFSTFLIGGGRVITLSMVMYPYISNADFGNGSVLGVVFVVINLTVFMMADRFARKSLKIENYLFD